MYLSLIIPFFNSEHKSKRLINRLIETNIKGVEFIFIDDGSSDDTYNMLINFKNKSSVTNITVIKQKNKGPGGARNAGLEIAKGRYVWFVDSDDDITIEALEFIKNNSSGNYDFIDFNILRVGRGVVNSMDIEEGVYNNNEEVRSMLVASRFIPQTSKVFKRDLLINNFFQYPEYCYYEDIQAAFIIPFYVKTFLKSDIVGYIHYFDFESITRNGLSLRSFDRLHTTIDGLKEGLKLVENSIEADNIKRLFIQFYLLEAIEDFFSKKPGAKWIATWRVINHYRRLSKEFNIKESPLNIIQNRSFKYQLYFYSHWFFSYIFLKNQKYYFDKVKRKAWSR